MHPILGGALYVTFVHKALPCIFRGLHHIIVDYVPRGGPLKFAELLTKGAFGVQVAGLAYINYKDVGICKLIALTLGL